MKKVFSFFKQCGFTRYLLGATISAGFTVGLSNLSWFTIVPGCAALIVSVVDVGIDAVEHFKNTWGKNGRS